MNICVVGLGSIAKRHINNIKKLYPDAEIDILRHSKGTDSSVDLCNVAVGDSAINGADNIRTAVAVTDDASIYGHSVYSYDDLADSYDAIFITNPTTMHIDTLHKLVDKSQAFFIEKPLRPMGCREDSIDSLPSDKVFYVACPLRYTGIVRYLKENIDWNNVYSLRAMSSSYLPEWRPGTDYSKCYSARRDLGGGVAADLIHEWDYISYLIGKPKSVHVIERKLSKLNIDVEDVALYIGEYDDKLVEVHLDYFGRQTLRDLYIFMEDDTVYCNLVKNTVTFLKQDKTIAFDEARDDYQTAELKHFFDIAAGKTINDNSAKEAESLMRVLEAGR